LTSICIFFVFSPKNNRSRTNTSKNKKKGAQILTPRSKNYQLRFLDSKNDQFCLRFEKLFNSFYQFDKRSPRIFPNKVTGKYFIPISYSNDSILSFSICHSVKIAKTLIS